MIQTWLFRILWLIALVLLQALVLNNVNAFGYATPYIYIYLILRIEVESSRNSVMLWAFACGLLVDIFSDTPGINAAASVFVAFIRLFVLRLFAMHDSIEQGCPSIKTIGLGAFTKYVSTCTLLHHAILVILCYFSLDSAGEILLRILLSSIMTIVFIIVLDNIRK